MGEMVYEKTITEQDKKVALTVAILSSFLTPFMISSLNIALPTIAKEFSTNAILMGWVATSYLLTTATFLIPIGKLSDIYGRKKIFVYGIFLFTLTSLLCGIASSIQQLILFRSLQGIGSAIIFSTSTAIITAIFPQSERGKVLGITASSVYTGLSIGPFLGGVITDLLSWRTIFFLVTPVGIAIIYLMLKFLKLEWADSKGDRYDYFGAILYIFLSSCMMLGITNLLTRFGQILFVTGIILLIVFLIVELNVTTPILDVRLILTNKAFFFSNLAALANYSATFAVTFLLSIYLQYIKGFSPKLAGTFIIVLPVMMAIFSPFAGRLSDRIEPRILSSTGMFVIGVSFIPLSFIKEQSHYASILIALFFQGVGFALFSSPNTNAIMSSVERRFYGVASAIMATMRMIGQSLSLGISLLIFSIFLGTAKITSQNHPALIKSIGTGFVIFTIISFLGMFASLKRGNIHRKAQKVKS